MYTKVYSLHFFQGKVRPKIQQLNFTDLEKYPEVFLRRRGLQI